MSLIKIKRVPATYTVVVVKIPLHGIQKRCLSEITIAECDHRYYVTWSEGRYRHYYAVLTEQSSQKEGTTAEQSSHAYLSAAVS